MCLNCGSFGQLDDENKLIGCSQCGQCYHTYCAGINVCKVMLQKGWRCLDCTVCEGCGKATDEGRLLLCDDCDISYHIYCLTPPLDQVPKGNWKCKWCVKCLKCGSKTPGGSMCDWKDNYTECSICYSLSQCHLCELNYNNDEFISKCIRCERWSHLSCKQSLNEDEANNLIKQEFTCSSCVKEKEAEFVMYGNLVNKNQNQLLEEMSKFKQLPSFISKPK